MEFLSEFGLFLAKSITLVICLGAVIVIIAASSGRTKHKHGELELRNLSDEFKQRVSKIRHELLSKDEQKREKKAQKQKEKAEKKQKVEAQPRLFVIDFKGSIDAKEVGALREEVTSVLALANSEQDEVLIRLESGGGVVHGYGLAASQLKRLRDANLKLTISVDKVAASGGYMMASLADKIIAAPFAIVGSIGVIAQLPNFHRVLKKNDIEFEQITAGEFKRTLTVFGENTDSAREKFREEIEQTHGLFKAFVSEFRPQLELEKVATGEHWFATQALELNLVDELRTSDDYLMAHYESHQVIQLSFHGRKKLSERLSQSASDAAVASVDKLAQRANWDWTR